MKTSKIGFYCVCLLVFGCGVGGSRESDGEKSLSREISDSLKGSLAQFDAKLIPTDVGGDSFCLPFELTNEPKVYLNCWEVSEEFPTSYVWEGGDSLVALDVPIAGDFISSVEAVDGAILGFEHKILENPDTEDPQNVHFRPESVRSFYWDGEQFTYLDELGYGAGSLSANGEYILTYPLDDSSNVTSVLKDLKPITYSNPPSDLYLIPFSVSNDGTVFGIANYQTEAQSFNAAFAFRQTESDFSLISSRGRAEYSSISNIVASPSNNYAYTYNSDETYTINYDNSGLGTETGFVQKGVLVIGDEEYDISYPADSKYAINISGINDNNIVYGIYYNPSILTEEVRNFLFSPKSGFKTVEEVFPNVGVYSIDYINDNNDVLIEIDDLSDSDTVLSTYLVKLPDSF